MVVGRDVGIDITLDGHIQFYYITHGKRVNVYNTKDHYDYNYSHQTQYNPDLKMEHTNTIQKTSHMKQEDNFNLYIQTVVFITTMKEYLL